MPLTPLQIDSGIPAYPDSMYIVGDASGTALVVNPGDWVIHSGNYLVAADDGVAYWKASGAGIALDRNPAYDLAGRIVPNSALVVATRGIFHASASFSGRPNNGVIVFPDATGSGVNLPSGITGMGSTWGTAPPASVSGGTAANAGKGVAQLINWSNPGPGGTGQVTFRLWDRNGDFY